MHSIKVIQALNIITLNGLDINCQIAAQTISKKLTKHQSILALKHALGLLVYVWATNNRHDGNALFK